MNQILERGSVNNNRIRKKSLCVYLLYCEMQVDLKIIRIFFMNEFNFLCHSSYESTIAGKYWIESLRVTIL